MELRIEHGKGGHDREVPLSPTLLTALRDYYRWMRPQTYLFPGTQNGITAFDHLINQIMSQGAEPLSITRNTRRAEPGENRQAVTPVLPQAFKSGRGDWIRTSDPLRPSTNLIIYQVVG
jgi:hypothetical protein